MSHTKKKRRPPLDINETGAEIFQDGRCPHSRFCGGCIYQGEPYEQQLKAKESETRTLFEKAGIEPADFAPIEGCPEHSRLAYRNKMEYTFGDLVKGGPMTLGMHRRKMFMSVVTTDQCQLVSPDFNRILDYTLAFCRTRGYVKYDKKSHEGLLRNLVIRRGVHTNELLLNIVTSTSEPGFDEEAWVSGLLSLKLEDRIVGILHTFNDSMADAVKCDDMKTLFGKDYYNERIMGLHFTVHEYAFFQTNIEAVERLYAHALSLIDDVDGKNVFDLYCGTGTITQVLARSAKHVLGVEIVPESVEAARTNAALNGLTNCEFVCGDVFRVLEEREEKPDVIVVDPPRVGMSREAVEKIAGYGVDQIVYISCNPKTLVQNLAQYQELGYTVSYVKPFDNFPMTRHVETVVLMSRVEGK